MNETETKRQQENARKLQNIQEHENMVEKLKPLFELGYGAT